MSLVESLLGYRNFAGEHEICRRIEQSKFYDSSKESTEDAASLLIFETSRQHTWLVATEERLYFVIDDIRKPSPRIGRSVHRNELRLEPDGRDGRVAVNTRPKSDRTGLVDIGLRRRGWLYSKRLFSELRIDSAVNELLATTDGRMIDDENVRDVGVELNR